MVMETAGPVVLPEVTTQAWEGEMKSSRSVTKTDILEPEEQQLSLLGAFGDKG